MQFLSNPGGPGPAQQPAHEHRAWRWALFACAAIGTVCTTQPWIRVQFDRLFGDHVGPAGWQSSAGFTCFCTCLLVPVLALAETDTPSARTAVRPGSLLLVLISTLVLMLEWWNGPGWLRGVSAAWTSWFYLLLLSLPMLLVTCVRRWAVTRAQVS